MDEFTIAIALWDGVEELDFAGPYEVLAAWARMSERPITVRTVASSAEAVRCSHELKVVPDSTWEDVGRLDVLVLPGGDTRPLQADESFLERMRTLAGSRTLMTSVCTGALVFGKAGILEGRRATTHWGARSTASPISVSTSTGKHASSTPARSSPPLACRRASTWRCTSSRGSSPSSARRRYAATSSTTRSRPSRRRPRHVAYPADTTDAALRRAGRHRHRLAVRHHHGHEPRR